MSADVTALTGKGAGEVAAHIRSIAAEHHVPMLQAAPLARALYRATEVGERIPPGLFAAVAEVLTWVYRLRAATPGDQPEKPNPAVDDALGAPLT